MALTTGLQEYFALSEEGVRASLNVLAFDPSTETIRQFNIRFNDILQASPNLPSNKEGVEMYIKALGRGD